MTTIAGCLLKQGQQIERSKSYIGTLGFIGLDGAQNPNNEKKFRLYLIIEDDSFNNQSINQDSVGSLIT